eukprot:jgi/Mesen1/3097/ME000184S02162
MASWCKTPGACIFHYILFSLLLLLSSRLPSSQQASVTRDALYDAFASDSKGRLLLNVASIPVARLSWALGWLSHQEQVQWIAPQPRSKLHNVYASSTLQSAGSAGLATGVRPSAPFGSARPLWDAGLMGEGQIVGVGDSGVDFQSCFFRDDEVLAPGPDHRKVVQYRVAPGGDALDEEGHGTHVCGSVLGSIPAAQVNGSAALADISQYSGMAPGARLYFTDMGVGHVGYVTPPADLGNGHYSYAFEGGARVHSDSWGTGSA